VLGASRHYYERFRTLDVNGAPATTGMREFVVGTGGRSHGKATTIAPGCEFRNTTNFGVLKMSLHAGSFDWAFLNEAGSTLDSGTQPCR